MRRANHGMRIIMHEQESQLGSENKKAEIQEKKKPVLLRELQKELQHLQNIDENDFKQDKDPYHSDLILERLQVIEKEAVRYDLKEIQKLCKLAIGKRILNIELRKKKEEHNSKMLKKQKIELFFRENRIKRYNYQSLIEEKLKDSTLIVRAYQNGKGFVESTARYKEDYGEALNQCDYIETIKTVNKIFYKNYSSIHKGNLTPDDVILKIVWIPIAVFVALAITLPFASFNYEQVVLMGLLGLILFLLLWVSVRTFCFAPGDNNQIEQSTQDVGGYFEELNQRFQEKGLNIQWSCSKDFMFLEVIFHSGFPS